MRRYSYILSFFVELPLAAELQPVEVSSGRPNIEKIKNLNSKVYGKCSVRIESAQILLLPAAKSVILEFRSSSFLNNNVMLCQQLTS